ncbi:TetR/AcrR family transcriptional regulator [Paenibacillus sp. UMB4589-SE434]|uniref:TetR/AcrR family transcriptional regulator n=1 Tax=Paenibacillus sp. UMB4589-SE434 TaxID=3046314 RepID=UPI00254B6132|nr:TetR/AcrR family transcriptional regulator [Paenibacillus sp. UMB4589-SE434]MDK8182375.1 TetR/AcrR family transcriptional regulator [Paenibacillus sp. UMB4589-SE434]
MIEKRKLRILNATNRVISQVGIAGTTMRKIADEAGLSTGALYHHYKSKEDILYDAMDRSLSVSTRMAEDTKQGKYSRAEAIEQIERDLKKRFNKKDDNRIQFYLAQEAMLGNEDISLKFKEKYQSWIGHVDDLLQRIYDIQPTRHNKALASLLIGSIDGIVMQMLLGSNTVEIDDICEVYHQLLVKGIPALLEQWSD